MKYGVKNRLQALMFSVLLFLTFRALLQNSIFHSRERFIWKSAISFIYMSLDFLLLKIEWIRYFYIENRYHQSHFIGKLLWLSLISILVSVPEVRATHPSAGSWKPAGNMVGFVFFIFYIISIFIISRLSVNQINTIWERWIHKKKSSKTQHWDYFL